MSLAILRCLLIAAGLWIVSGIVAPHVAQAAAPALATSTTVTSTSASSLTLTKPSGVKTGDLLIILVGNNNTSATAQWDNSTLKPGGFSFINESGGSTPACHTAAFYRIADGTEQSSTSTPAQASANYWGFYIRIAGASTTNPIVQTGSDSNTTADARYLSITGVTTTYANELVMYVHCFDGGDSGVFLATTTYWAKAQEVRTANSSTNASGSWGSRIATTTGATGNLVVATPIQADGWSGFQFAIAPGNTAPTTLTTDVQVTGSVYVAGAVSKGAGTFMIDDPLDPKNKLLYHSFVESPDVKNIYDGVAELDINGEATIELPSYFLPLNKDFRYLATPLDAPMPNLYISKEIHKKFFGLFGSPVFTITGGVPGGRVSWQVTGVRHDPVIEDSGYQVEKIKGPDTIVPRGECIFAPLCK